MNRLPRVGVAVLAVLGGWLVVLPGDLMLLSLRVSDIESGGAPEAYSWMLAIGWAVLVAGLAAFGRLSDTARRRGIPRSWLSLAALPIGVASAVAFAGIDSLLAVGLSWVALQLVCAAIIAPSMGELGERVVPRSRGMASAMTGLAPTVAILFGAGLARISGWGAGANMAVCVMLGLTLALPLIVMNRTVDGRAAFSVGDGAPTPVAPQRPSRRAAGVWIQFVLATFLVATCISTANSYVVLFVDRVSTVATSEVATTAASLVLASALFAIVGAVVGGALSRTGRASGLTIAAAATVIGAAVAFIAWKPTPVAMLIGAVALGVGIGVESGARLAYALHLARWPQRLGRDLGMLNAATAVPHVVVPAVAALLLSGDAAVGLRLMFVGSAAFAIVGAALLIWTIVKGERSPRDSGRQAVARFVE